MKTATTKRNRDVGLLRITISIEGKVVATSLLHIAYFKDASLSQEMDSAFFAAKRSYLNDRATKQWQHYRTIAEGFSWKGRKRQ